MNSLTIEEKISKFKKRKTQLNNNNENRRNYELLISKVGPKYSNYQKLYITKKNKHNNNIFNLKSNEFQLENIYNKINDKFYDKRNERDSLILQIAGTESLKEIKYKKHKKENDIFIISSTRIKTPEKKVTDIKKKVKAK